MKRSEAIDKAADALRSLEMAGHITVDWERVPKAQKRKWWAKSAVMLEAIQFVGDGEEPTS
ncbi:MAG TPA: hypothetical protein VLC51_01185 [Nitrospira sp.]|nr:hypothetical protein [Nitrospira sp.]